MEEFVDIELARRLKDLGYSTSFFFFYRTDDKLLHHARVSNPLVYGKEVKDEIEPIVSAIIVPNFDEIKKATGKNELTSEEVHKLIENEVKKYNKKMPTYKYVKNIEIRNEELEKTTTHKIKRTNQK